MGAVLLIPEDRVTGETAQLGVNYGRSAEQNQVSDSPELIRAVAHSGRQCPDNKHQFCDIIQYWTDYTQNNLLTSSVATFFCKEDNTIA